MRLPVATVCLPKVNGLQAGCLGELDPLPCSQQTQLFQRYRDLSKPSLVPCDMSLNEERDSRVT